MKETYNRLKENVQDATKFRTAHPMTQPQDRGNEAAKAMYHRFYGKKMP